MLALRLGGKELIRTTQSHMSLVHHLTISTSKLVTAPPDPNNARWTSIIEHYVWSCLLVHHLSIGICDGLHRGCIELVVIRNKPPMLVCAHCPTSSRISNLCLKTLLSIECPLAQCLRHSQGILVLVYGPGKGFSTEMQPKDSWAPEILVSESRK